MDSNEKGPIRKADVIFLIVVLAAALISFFILRLNSTRGSYATISYGNNIQNIQIPLNQAEPRYFLLTYVNSSDMALYSVTANDTDSETEFSEVYIEEFTEEEWQHVTLPETEYNVFLCQNQKIRMVQSSCPDKICVHHSAISMTGENIICLPHKLVIEISGDEKNDLDGVAY